MCNFPVLTDFIFSTLSLLQNVREPSSSPPAALSATSVPKSGSYRMIQYLQSWFPGWGGWSGNTQDLDTPEELLPSPSSWNILREQQAADWKRLICYPCSVEEWSALCHAVILNSSDSSPAETGDLFDPLEDSQSLNTFTRRDYMFARMEFFLEKGGVTLFHEERRANSMHESGVLQLEFSGTNRETSVYFSSWINTLK